MPLLPILLCLSLLFSAVVKAEVSLQSRFQTSYTYVSKHAGTFDVSTSSPVYSQFWGKLGFTQTKMPSILAEPIYGAALGVNTLRQNNWAGGVNWSFWGRDDAFMAQRVRMNINWQSNTWYARVSPIIRTYKFNSNGGVRNDSLVELHFQKPFARLLTLDFKWHSVLGGAKYSEVSNDRDYQIAQSYEAYRLDRGMDKSRATAAMNIRQGPASYAFEWSRINPLAQAPSITQLSFNTTLKFSTKWELLFGLGQMLDGEQYSHDYINIGFQSGFH